MPFFENAKQFNITGGSFIDLKGNQNNYHYDQSLKVDGQGNSATYTHGPYYNGPNNSTTNHAGHMTVIGQGANARVALGANSMPFNYSHSQPNFPPHFDQSYGHLQAHAPPQAQPHGYGPPNGMFSNSTGHLNPNPPYHPPPSPQQPPHHYPNSFPSSPQPVGHPYPGPAQPQYGPAQPQYSPAQPQYSPAQPQYAPSHHSQTSIHSAPANVNAQPIQITQINHQRAESQPSGSVSQNMAPQQTPPQPSQQPQVGNQAAPANNGMLSAPVLQSNPSSSGSVLSGTTLAQSPQPMAVDPFTAASSPTSSAAGSTATAATTSTAATTATGTSTSSASSPVTQGQLEEIVNDFPALMVLKPGHTTATQGSQEEEKKKKKKKKSRFFSKWFKKTPKETVVVAGA